MRLFRLTNADGAKYDLQNKSNVMFFDPEGLGYDEDTSYQKIGSQFAVIEDVLKQHQISGTLVFNGTDCNTKFYNFVRFARKAPLILEYTADEKFFIKCRMSKISKTENINNKKLICPVVFTALGIFYRESYQINDATISGGKVYDYTYPYQYSSTLAQTVEITSDSINDSPCKITIYGEAINPRWNHYVDGKLVATGSMDGTVQENHKLIIDSTSIPYQIKEFDLANRLIADRYPFCDYSTERFCFLQYGKNRFTISHEGTNQIKVMVEAQLEYESV